MVIEYILMIVVAFIVGILINPFTRYCGKCPRLTKAITGSGLICLVGVILYLGWFALIREDYLMSLISMLGLSLVVSLGTDFLPRHYEKKIKVESFGK